MYKGCKASYLPKRKVLLMNQTDLVDKAGVKTLLGVKS
jgi:hypothetical protein